MKRLLPLVLAIVLLASSALALTAKLQIDSGQSLEIQFNAFRDYLRSLNQTDRDRWLNELITISIQGLSSAPSGQATTAPSKKQTATIGQQNALGTARDYLNYTAFSYSGLIKQLDYEGYSSEEAKYGADNCGADWNQQAAKCAKSYLEYTSFSRKGLIEQLEYEGFTRSQAEYGVKQNGY